MCLIRVRGQGCQDRPDDVGRDGARLQEGLTTVSPPLYSIFPLHPFSSPFYLTTTSTTTTIMDAVKVNLTLFPSCRLFYSSSDALPPPVSSLLQTFLSKHDKAGSTEVCSETGPSVTQENVTGHVHQEDATAIDRERHIHHHRSSFSFLACPTATN